MDETLRKEFASQASDYLPTLKALNNSLVVSEYIKFLESRVGTLTAERDRLKEKIKIAPYLPGCYVQYNDEWIREFKQRVTKDNPLTAQLKRLKENKPQMVTKFSSGIVSFGKGKTADELNMGWLKPAENTLPLRAYFKTEK